MPQEVAVANRITQAEYDELFKFNKRTDALRHALEIRQFEIELYWKRALISGLSSVPRSQATVL